MNGVLVLRAELVCLLILLYLTFISRTYRMGKDVRVFNQILFFSISHVIMDIMILQFHFMEIKATGKTGI